MKTDTIIIGGGISGLSCARRLHDKGFDFLLITKELGGRMKSSESFAVNFGAAYVTKDYKNVLKYVEKGDKLNMRDFHFFDGKKFTTFYSLGNIRFLPSLVRILFLTWRIRNHINVFRKNADKKSMRECFENDKFLMKFWLMPAREFIKKYNFELVNSYFVDPVTAATAFVPSDDVNTVYLLSMIYPGIIKSWTVDFTHTIEKLTEGYTEKIKIAEVNKVVKNRNGNYVVEFGNNKIEAKNVVFAAPQKQLKQVYDLPDKNIEQDVYVFNVSGVRKKKFRNKVAVIFRNGDQDVNMIWKQKDGSDIIYTLNPHPDLKQFYDRFKVVDRIHWEPAMIIPKCCIIDQDLGENLYLASDYNVSGLEDSFLSGLYAANRIINSK